MNNIVEIKSIGNGVDVEYEVFPVVDIENIQNERQRRIVAGTAEIDEQLSEVQEKIEHLNSDVDRLTNHADGIDYSIAVISGIITGIIDATVVGEWNISRAKSETRNNIEKKSLILQKSNQIISLIAN